MVGLEGDHAGESGPSALGVPSRRIVVAQIIEQRWRMRVYLHRLVVITLRLIVTLLGVEDHPHQSLGASVARMLAESRPQHLLGLCRFAFFERSKRLLIYGGGNLVLSDDRPTRRYPEQDYRQKNQPESHDGHRRSAFCGWEVATEHAGQR